MGEVAFGRTPQGQMFYDLCFTDLSPRTVARKHGLGLHEVMELRAKARTTMLKASRVKLTKAQRERAVQSCIELNKALDRQRD